MLSLLSLPCPVQDPATKDLLNSLAASACLNRTGAVSMPGLAAADMVKDSERHKDKGIYVGSWPGTAAGSGGCEYPCCGHHSVARYATSLSAQEVCRALSAGVLAAHVIIMGSWMQCRQGHQPSMPLQPTFPIASRRHQLTRLCCLCLRCVPADGGGSSGGSSGSSSTEIKVTLSKVYDALTEQHTYEVAGTSPQINTLLLQQLRSGSLSSTAEQSLLRHLGNVVAFARAAVASMASNC